RSMVFTSFRDARRPSAQGVGRSPALILSESPLAASRTASIKSEWRIEGPRSMLKVLMISALSLTASSAVAVAGDVAAGQTSFKKCAPCHDVGETAKNKVGPE